MASLNKVMILGNVGHAPELRQTQSGLAVANFSVATTEGWKDGDERKSRTDWHQVVVWGKLAETCAQYLTTGRQVFVEGQLRSRSYADQDGHKRFVTEIVAQQVQFLGGRPEEATPPTQASPAPAPLPPSGGEEERDAAARQAEGEAAYARAAAAYREQQAAQGGNPQPDEKEATP